MFIWKINQDEFLLYILQKCVEFSTGVKKKKTLTVEKQHWEKCSQLLTTYDNK